MGADCSGVTTAILQNVAYGERRFDDFAFRNITCTVDPRR